MSRQTQQMWTTLVQAGLVHGPAPKTRMPDSPWYVKVLLAFSGWLASLFMLGFIAVSLNFLLESSFATFAVGDVMIVGAYAFLCTHKSDFFEHLALSASLAGQALIVWVIFDNFNGTGATAWLLVALLQVPLAVFMPSFIHRVLSSFAAVFAFSAALIAIGTPNVFGSVIMLLAAWLWLNEFRYPQHIKKFQAIGYGLALALIFQQSPVLLGLGSMDFLISYKQTTPWDRPWMGEVLASAVTLYVVWQLLQRRGWAISDRLAIASLLGTLLICLVSVEAPGITAGMVVMLLGFAGGNRVLLGLGVVSLLSHISSYYYLLDATLLAKAQTLLIVGLVLLAVRWLLLRFLPPENEVKHA